MQTFHGVVPQMKLPASATPLPSSYTTLPVTTPLYRIGAAYSCPDCGQSQWIVGRIHAECAGCETVLPIAATRSIFTG